MYCIRCLPYRWTHLALVLPAGTVVRDNVMLVRDRRFARRQRMGDDEGSGAVGRRSGTAAGTVRPRAAPVQTAQTSRRLHPPVFYTS